MQVAGWMRQTWELTVRNFRRELCIPCQSRMPMVCCTVRRQAGNEPQHPTYATQPAHPRPPWARITPAIPCREYNRNLLYSVIRGAIMLAVAVVFATLFIGKGSRYDTFAGERGVGRIWQDLVGICKPLKNSLPRSMRSRPACSPSWPPRSLLPVGVLNIVGAMYSCCMFCGLTVCYLVRSVA